MSCTSPAETAIVISFVVVVNIIIWMVLIAAIGLGAMHLDSCPLQPYIPIYLIVIGLSSIVSLLLAYVKDILVVGFLSNLYSGCLPLLHFFNICWFISGTVWIFSIHPPNYDSANGEGYCQSTLYLFAFWFNCLCWLVGAVVFVFGGLYLFYVRVKLAFREHRLFPSNNRSYGAHEETCAA